MSKTIPTGALHSKGKGIIMVSLTVFYAVGGGLMGADPISRTYFVYVAIVCVTMIVIWLLLNIIPNNDE